MLKFYDYHGNEHPKESAINYSYSIKYIIVETDYDEAVLEHTIDMYINDMYIKNNQGNMLDSLLKPMKDLRKSIERRHFAVDCAIDKGITDKVRYLSYPNVWVFNNLSSAWVLSNHIIHDITSLNDIMKNLKSNSDSKIEIEN